MSLEGMIARNEDDGEAAFNTYHALLDFARHQQWDVITEAVDKYSRGEKSDLVSLGIIAQGVLILDEIRCAALKSAGAA